MMTNYTDLQKAAEYAAQDTIKFADEDEEMRALQQFHEEVDPETVLALIAENDLLVAACEKAEQIINIECKASSFDQARANLLETERDRLRAEVAGLRTGYEAYEQVNAELKAENEALRGAGAGALRFVAFAFDEGVEGAELAGRAIEDAIGAKS